MVKPTRKPQNLAKIREDLSRKHGVPLSEMGAFYTHPKINFTREQMIEHEIERTTEFCRLHNTPMPAAVIRAGAERNVNKWLARKKK